MVWERRGAWVARPPGHSRVFGVEILTPSPSPTKLERGRLKLEEMSAQVKIQAG